MRRFALLSVPTISCVTGTAHARRNDTLLTVASKDGASIAHRRSGHGPPLVLVHGTPATDTRQVRPLAPTPAHRRVDTPRPLR